MSQGRDMSHTNIIDVWRVEKGGKAVKGTLGFLFPMQLCGIFNFKELLGKLIK